MVRVRVERGVLGDACGWLEALGPELGGRERERVQARRAMSPSMGGSAPSWGEPCSRS